MKKFLIILSTSLFLTSCSQSLFNFTIVSTKNIELSKLSSLQKSVKTKGEDKTSIIIVIPAHQIKIDKAINNTIDEIPGCVALLDGNVTIKTWYIPYIYGEQKFVIEATALIDPSFVKSTNGLPKFGKVTLDKEGKVKSFVAISQTSFEKEKRSMGNKKQN